MQQTGWPSGLGTLARVVGPFQNQSTRRGIEPRANRMGSLPVVQAPFRHTLGMQDSWHTLALIVMRPSAGNTALPQL